MNAFTRIRGAADSLVNFISGLGTSADKSTASRYAFALLDDAQLEFAYRGDWLARKIVDIPAEDATKNWLSWKTEKENIEAIEEEEARLSVQEKVQKGLQLGRLYGGAGIIIGIDGQEPEEELDPESVKKDSLKYLHVVPRRRLTANEGVIWNLDSPWFGEPKVYVLNGQAGELAAQTRIHPSRVVRFLGNQLPDPEGGTTGIGGQGWGDTVLQCLDDAIKQMDTVSQSAAALVQEAKVDVLKLPNFSTQITTQSYPDALTSRLQYSQMAKGLFGFLLMDAKEEWKRIEQNFSQLPELVRVYMMIVAGAADIPATRLFGQSPQGLNATGDGDLRNYYDNVAARQRTDLDPKLKRLFDVLVRSALGNYPDDIYREWNPLYQLDPVQAADAFLKEVTAIEKIATSGLVPSPALDKAVQNKLIESGHLPGLEAALEEHPEDETEEEPLEGELPGEALPQRAPGEEITPEQRARTEPRIRKLKLEVGADRLVTDARPRTLYVYRKVTNAEDIVRWAKSEGFETTLPASDMHVTIAFSRAAVDWMKVGQGYSDDEMGKMKIPPGGPRLVEKLGARAHVLLFTSSWLSWRHESIRRAGASWDFEEYQPHITISYRESSKPIDDITPYRGAILLGPEIFEEINEEWEGVIVEDWKVLAKEARP